MTNRRSFLLMTAGIALAGCAGPPPPAERLGPDGRPLPRRYSIGPGDESTIQFRMLDSLNTLRQSAGAGPVAYDARLNAAAATHARDMSIQNRPWHFGSDGSSPIDRVSRAGYQGRLVGEAISETYETELQTLAAWMEQPSVREVLLDPSARDIGFAWWQENNGKLWWCLVLGAPRMGGTGGNA